MASISLMKRLTDLEARLGAGAALAVGMTCPTCGTPRPWTDTGTCPHHGPLPEADLLLLVTFVSPA